MAQDNDRDDKRGFAGMDEEERDMTSKGGKSQGKENKPGNFGNDAERVDEAEQK